MEVDNVYMLFYLDKPILKILHYFSTNIQVGVPSDYGKQLMIGRIPQQDQILYQTERYNPQTFGYDMPVSGRFVNVCIVKNPSKGVACHF